MKRRKMAEQILETLTQQTFADFYSDDGIFGQYIMGFRTDKEAMKKQVLEEIEELFFLKK